MTDNIYYKALLYIMNNASDEQLEKSIHFMQRRLNRHIKIPYINIDEKYKKFFDNIAKQNEIAKNDINTYFMAGIPVEDDNNDDDEGGYK